MSSCRWSLPATAAIALAWWSTGSWASATWSLAARRRLGKVPNINSSSVLEDGWPVLIVDVEDLIRSIDNLLSGRRLGKLTADGGLQRQVARPGESGRRRLDHGPRARAAAAGKPRLRRRYRGRRRRWLERGRSGPLRPGRQRCRHAADGRHPARPAYQGRRAAQGIPVVIVSYKDREEDRIRGLDAGANAT